MLVYDEQSIFECKWLLLTFQDTISFLLKGFVLAIVAQEISSRPANAKHTYGLVRAEVSIIVAAFEL